MLRPISRSVSVLALAWLAVGTQAALAQGFRPGDLRKKEDVETFLTPPAQEDVAENRWRVADGIELAYLAHGEGTPVLFLHGGPGFPPAAIAPGLVQLEGFRSYAYHQRGCGASTRPIDRFEGTNYLANMVKLTGALGAVQQIGDVDRIRGLLGVEKIHLIGHSYGGFLAALYAAEFPERVERLVLVTPAELLRMPNPNGGMFDVLPQFLPEGEMRTGFADYLGRFFGAFGTCFSMNEEELVALNREFATYFRAALEEQGLPTGPVEAPEGLDSGWMPFAMYLSFGMQYDHREALKKVDCPVLVLRGGKDFLSSEENLRDYTDFLPRVRVVTIEESAHFPQYERPEEFAEIVGAFLGED